MKSCIDLLDRVDFEVSQSFTVTLKTVDINILLIL